MKTIERKSMLYRTGVEYGDFTMNHVLGCAHGCKYPCYAYLMARRFGNVASYNDWIEPKLVSNTLDLLDHELPRLKDRIKSVQLCFTTDPFMCGYEEVVDMSLAAVQKLNDYGVACVILTKGLLPEKLATFSTGNTYGITLVSLDEGYRSRIEPGAAPYGERLLALKRLHDAGCKTWVSIEPYPTPNMIRQNLDTILDSVSFVDRIIFGRTNYNKRVSAYPQHREFYNAEAQRVTAFCQQHNIDCFVKTGTITRLAQPAAPSTSVGATVTQLNMVGGV